MKLKELYDQLLISFASNIKIPSRAKRNRLLALLLKRLVGPNYRGLLFSLDVFDRSLSIGLGLLLGGGGDVAGLVAVVDTHDDGKLRV